MNIKEEQICRLCLKVTEYDFEIIEEITKEMLDALLLKVNLGVSKDPIVCKSCAEILRKCFDFRSVCIDREEIIPSFPVEENGARLRSKDVFRDGNDIKTFDDNFICRFCSNRLTENNILLSTLNDNITFPEMLQALIPETNLDVMKNPLICISCKEDLDCYMKFAENCLDVEEKINKYRQNAGICTSSQVVLNEVVRFLYENVVDLNYTQINAIKREEAYEDELIKTEKELDIKEHGANLHETAYDTLIDMQEYKLNIPRGLKTETEITETLTQNSSFAATTSIYGECESRSNKVSSETEMEESFKTESNCAVNKKNYTPSSKSVSVPQIFNCALCTYQANRKGGLKRHMLIHKHITQVETFKCTLCTHETKHKRSLQRHMLIHKDIVDMKTYKCPMCTYVAKQKCNLKRHILIHKNITEVEIYKCSLCIYETKHKRSLKRHMIIHEDVIDKKIHKCSQCTYKAKRKDHLKTHMLIHKDVREVEMYNCSTCNFETKYKLMLKRHTLIHKDITEVETFKCSMCTYESKRKSNLQEHVLVHKDSTQMEMYKCSMCTHETKRSGNLKTHMLIHKDRIIHKE